MGQSCKQGITKTNKVFERKKETFRLATGDLFSFNFYSNCHEFMFIAHHVLLDGLQGIGD